MADLEAARAVVDIERGRLDTARSRTTRETPVALIQVELVEPILDLCADLIAEVEAHRQDLVTNLLEDEAERLRAAVAWAWNYRDRLPEVAVDALLDAGAEDLPLPTAWATHMEGDQ